MTTRRSTKAEEFARALDGRATGRSADPAVAGLLAVAAGLRAIPQRPVPAFREGLRARLVAEATQLAPGAPAGPVPPAAPAGPPPVLPAPAAVAPFAQVAVGVVALGVAVAGTSVATHRALPGDALYGVKRTVERLRLAVAGGAVDEGVELVAQARARLGELTALLDGGPVPVDRLAAVLGAFEEDTRRAATRLLAAADAGSARAYAELADFLAEAPVRLVALVPELPVALQARALATFGRLSTVDRELGALPPPDGSRTPAVVPRPSPSGRTPRPATSPSAVPSARPTAPRSPSPTDLPTVLPTRPTVPLPTVLPSLPPLLP